MENEERSLETKPERPDSAPITIGTRGLELTSFDSLWRFAVAVSKSGLAPKGIQTPEAIMVAAQMGLEVGLTPMAALQNIAVINGRPSLWGDAQLAVVRGTRELQEFEEWFEAGGKRVPRNPGTYADDTTAVCRVKRAGYPASEVAFSVADAKSAGLWNKEGPWRQYPFRMLKSRARAFALRDQFGDALKGIISSEEAQDGPIVELLQDQNGLHEVARLGAGEVALPADPAPEEAKRETPQEELAGIVLKAGYTFSELCAWGADTGHLPEADTIATFEDIPTKIAERLVRSRVGLVQGLVRSRVGLVQGLNALKATSVAATCAPSA